MVEWADLWACDADFAVPRLGAGRDAPSSWTLLADSKLDGMDLRMFCRRAPQSQHDEYLVEGILPVEWGQYLTAQADTEFRSTWDERLLEIVELSSCAVELADGPCRRGRSYMRVSYPWPLGQKEYLYETEVRAVAHESCGSFLCLAQAALPEEVGTKLRPMGDLRRIHDMRSHIAFGPCDGGTRFVSLYYEDPGISIPVRILRSMMAKAIPHGLAQLSGAARRCPSQRVAKLLDRLGLESLQGLSIRPALAGEQSVRSVPFSTAQEAKPCSLKPAAVGPVPYKMEGRVTCLDMLLTIAALFSVPSSSDRCRIIAKFLQGLCERGSG